MSGNSGRRFTIARPTTRTQPREDFAAVFAGTFTEQPATPMDIPIDAIEPSPYQARQEFADLEELAEAIRTHGFTSRIRVRTHPTSAERYQLVYGERRLRAAKLAGLTLIPCDVAQHSDADLREIGLIENLQRQDLAALEEAQAFRIMIDQNGYSIRTLAERIGKSKGYIQNKLDLLRTPADVQQMISRHADTQTAGLIIAQLPTEEQRHPLIEGVVAGTLDTRRVREMVDAILSAGAVPPSARVFEHPVAEDREPAAARAQTNQTAHSAAARHPGQDGPAASAAGAAERRRIRQSSQALTQAVQTLRAMTAQLRTTVDQLQPGDRAALLDHVVSEHFPELEQLIEELRS